MANTNASLYTSQNNGTKPLPALGLAKSVYGFVSKVALAAAGLNDTINFGYMPAGATIVEARLISDDLDSNGSPLITIDVGDAGLATRLFSASTCAQAGTADGRCQTAALGYQYTAKTIITGLIHAAAATFAAGSLTLIILYTVDGLAD